MKKFLFYLLFIIIGTATAEVLSFNHTIALYDPLGCLPYGVLYAFFVSYILEKRIQDWKTIYLFGILVGVITEGFFIKVLFFGWDINSYIFHGIAVSEFFILSFFFHPLFSFMLPVFVAKNYLNYPFAMQDSKRKKIFLWLLPLYPMIVAISMPGGNIVQAFIDYIISFFILVFLLWLTKKYVKKIDEVILGRFGKIFTSLILISIYILGFMTFKGPNGKIFPELPAFIFLSGFILFILYLIHKRKNNNYISEEVSFEPLYNLKNTITILAILILAMLLLSFLALTLSAAMSVFLLIYMFGGAIIGTLYFIFVVYNTFRKSNLSQMKKEE